MLVVIAVITLTRRSIIIGTEITLMVKATLAKIKPTSKKAAKKLKNCGLFYMACQPFEVISELSINELIAITMTLTQASIISP